MQFLKQRIWLVYAIAASIMWGLWGVVAKINAASNSPYINHALFTIGMLLTLPFVIKKVAIKETNTKGMCWGILSGVFAVTGNIAIYIAFNKGAQAAIAIPVTGLYPLVTIVLAVFLFKEKINAIQFIGMLVAIPALLLLSGQDMIFKQPALFFKSIGLDGWFIYCFIALFSWGVFSALQKLSTNFISASWGYVSFIIASVVITIIFLLNGNISFDITAKILWLGILAGILNGVGVLLSFKAFSADGKAGTVTVIIGILQPIFTIIPAVLFLNEKFGRLEVGGIILAIIGALFLSYEKKCST